MIVVLDVLAFVFWLLVIGLALFGGLVLVAVLVGPRETALQRIARQTREAERRVADIGRQAQAAILTEALRRAQAKSTTRTRPPDPMDRPNDGSYGPWDD